MSKQQFYFLILGCLIIPTISTNTCPLKIQSKKFINIYKCKSYSNFNKIYLEDKIKCEETIKNCPKVVEVSGKDLTPGSNLRFKLMDDKYDDLKFTLHIDWCDDNSFIVDDTFIKVKKQEPLGLAGVLIMLLLAFVVIAFLGAFLPDNSSAQDYFVGYMIGTLLNSGSSSTSYYGGSNSW